MKHLIFSVLLFLIGYTIQAQTFKKFYLELDLVRYTKETGGLSGYENSYIHGFDYIRGGGIGYRISPQLNVYTKYRRIYNNITPENTPDSYINGTDITKGHEFNVGTEWAPWADKIFHLSFAGDIFVETTGSKGTCGIYGCTVGEPDWIPAARKTLIGLAPKLRLNLKIYKGFSLFADARVKIARGIVKDAPNPNNDAFGKKSPNQEGYWLKSYDTLNALGLRFLF